MSLRRKAELWKPKDDAVICQVCPRRCRINDGKYGFCRGRYHEGGILYAENYGKVTAAVLDPIEKKPLYHFLPASKTFSISSFGCNFTCQHCQNYHLSQSGEVSFTDVSPANLLSEVRLTDAKSISFTYNEPAIWFEYIKEVTKLASTKSITSAMITNGYLTEEAFCEVAKNLGAVRVDLKAFTENFYQKICGAKLQPVLDTILLAKELKIHLELVTLIIPGLNDSAEEISRMLSWETENLGYAVPHHFTKFTPMYKMEQNTATPNETLDRIFCQAKEHGLFYPYLGNIQHQTGSDTICPDCGNLLIQRTGYTVKTSGIRNGKCLRCQRNIEGVFLSQL